MPLRIRLATPSEVIDLRHAILRAGLPRETAIFDNDDAPRSLHFIATDDDQTIACATLHLNQWETRPAWQLRGMAVAPSHQHRGVGSQLLAAIEESILASPPENPRLLWCNARVPAAPFYARHGWRIVSEVFQIPTAGPHVKMVRFLAPRGSQARCSMP